MRLNLGCGQEPIWGAINVDLTPLAGVQVAADITKGYLPFEDSSFDTITAFNVLEHIEDLTALMREIHRLLVPGGVLHVRTPHFTHRGAYSDPTHRRFFAYDTFLYYTRDFKWNYYFDFSFTGARVRLVFPKGKQMHNYIVEPLVNLCPIVYELSFLRSLFPAHLVESWLYR